LIVIGCPFWADIAGAPAATGTGSFAADIFVEAGNLSWATSEEDNKASAIRPAAMHLPFNVFLIKFPRPTRGPLHAGPHGPLLKYLLY
jgi:hypothetical protein